MEGGIRKARERDVGGGGERIMWGRRGERGPEKAQWRTKMQSREDAEVKKRVFCFSQKIVKQSFLKGEG